MSSKIMSYMKSGETALVPDEVVRALSKIREVESNIPASEMKLIEKAHFSHGVIHVRYHCVSPFCPMLFVLAMGLEMKQELLKLESVKEAKITVVNHYMADLINSKIEKFNPK